MKSEGKWPFNTVDTADRLEVYELKSFLLPGGECSFVVKINAPREFVNSTNTSTLDGIHRCRTWRTVRRAINISSILTRQCPPSTSHRANIRNPNEFYWNSSRQTFSECGGPRGWTANSVDTKHPPPLMKINESVHINVGSPYSLMIRHDRFEAILVKIQIYIPYVRNIFLLNSCCQLFLLRNRNRHLLMTSEDHWRRFFPTDWTSFDVGQR